MAFTSSVSLFFVLVLPISCAIDRSSIVRTFNPTRNASSLSTPIQVGNGNFAFGADITSLQTFLPYNTLTSWCWHNSSLPTTPNQTSPSDFTGLDWWTPPLGTEGTQGRLVNYEMPNPAEPDISQWMIANPHRVNVGRIGLWFGGSNVTEVELVGARQELDLYTGVLKSEFEVLGETVAVTVVADPESSTVAVRLESTLLQQGRLRVFWDFPYASGKSKFEDPFVGIWNATGNHTTTLLQEQGGYRGHRTGQGANIRHDMDATTYYTSVYWSGNASLTRETPSDHRYLLQTGGSSLLDFTTAYSASGEPPQRTEIDFDTLHRVSCAWWSAYWETGAFIDLTKVRSNKTAAASATELQRRIILSQYLLAVNGAGINPPQESGLTNNGWYGKFHAEMFFWHLGHWARWGKWSLLSRSMPRTYVDFLDSSKERAARQGYKGSRWGKMSDPSGRSAPGEINSLLIWQQPHVFQFAEYEWRAFPTPETLGKWEEVLWESAEFMADYVLWNGSTGVYDLAGPMYPMSENTEPNATRNAAFELAYWRFGLDIAEKWMQRLGEDVPKSWTTVRDNLAPLPVQDGAYVIYEGIEGMWETEAYTEDHPSMLGLYGWLPPSTPFNITIMQNTVSKVYETWNLTYSYGWDFPMLAMNAARMGDPDKAVEFLLYPGFDFDDAGYPIGGPRVATPYFPGSSSLLAAVAMLAGGWDGEEGVHFPESWTVDVEGFSPAL